MTASPLADTARIEACAGNSQRLILTRWVAGGLIVIGTLVSVRLLDLPLPELRLYALALLILGYNALLTHMHGRISQLTDEATCLKVSQRSIRLQIVLDWISLGAFLHFTGGVTSPAILILLIHMLLVAILLPDQSPYLYVTAGALIPAGIAALEAWGVIPHFRVIPTLPTDLHTSSVYIMAEIAFFAAAAFGMVFLVTDIMQRLRERDRQVAALLHTIESASDSLDTAHVLSAIARSAAEALGHRRAMIRVLDTSGELLQLSAAYGLSKSYLEKGAVDLIRSPLDAEVMQGQNVIVNETATDARIQYPQEVLAEGIHSILAVPVQGRGRILGVLRVYGQSPYAFTPTDAAFAAALAREGASALQNAQAHESLRRTEEARAQFVRTITHELRAPVSAAQSLLRTMLRGYMGDLTEQQSETMRRLEARLSGLMELINDLLALASSATVEFHEPNQRISLTNALRQSVEQFNGQACEKHITLTLEAAEALDIIATEEGLSRIFDNLIGNAIKYTPEGGRVSITLTERSNEALITVADSGIGIDAGYLPHIWEPFYRAPTVRESGVIGTGLGLAIVKRQVDVFGGCIMATSAPGQGTTFRLSLPLA